MSDEARNVELLRKAYDAWSQDAAAPARITGWSICAEQIAFGSLAHGPAGFAPT